MIKNLDIFNIAQNLLKSSCFSKIQYGKKFLDFTPYYSIPTASKLSHCFQSKKYHAKTHTKNRNVFSWIKTIANWLNYQKTQDIPLFNPCTSYPMSLKVPHLPEPSFFSHKPPRYLFFKNISMSLEDSHPNLLKEVPSNQEIHVKDHQEIKKILENRINLSGILRKSQDGYIYLCVEKRNFNFDKLILDQIDTDAENKLVSYLDSLSIPVATEDESIRAKHLGIFHEIGKTYSFKIEDIFETFFQQNRNKIRFFYATVSSTGLTDFREKYLLPSRLHGHSFHILLAAKVEIASDAKALTFRLNISCFAA
ncbi:MAG: hypothetical protein EBZ47_04565 [Chlamydiae bacterium]|nr:hypothetical protein [Chlamydiota bacterium]